jgi:hypothetical protein
MPYDRVPFDTTKPISCKKGIVSLFSRINDAIFIKNRYQLELDNANAAIINQVHYLEERSNEAMSKLNRARGLQKSIEAHSIERTNLYETLNNLLNKETDFESKMWQTTQNSNKVTSINIKQKFHESDVDELKFDSMLEYLKQYPTYASKTSFKEILEKIKEKEAELRREKEHYISSVSEYNNEISTWEKEIIKADSKFVDYNRFLEEGTNKLSKTKYINGVLYKISSEQAKQEVNLDTIKHRTSQFKETLDVIKKQYSEYKSTKLVEMTY